MGTTEIGEFIPQFAQATLENWQSEFLQLVSFVVLAALLIHRAARSRGTATTAWRKALSGSRADSTR